MLVKADSERGTVNRQPLCKRCYKTVTRHEEAAFRAFGKGTKLEILTYNTGAVRIVLLWKKGWQREKGEWEDLVRPSFSRSSILTVPARFSAFIPFCGLPKAKSFFLPSKLFHSIINLAAYYTVPRSDSALANLRENSPKACRNRDRE
jgi:hypothetical protein